MMKWGRKGSHSSPTYMINHVFPISWLKKLKAKSASFQLGTQPQKPKSKVAEMARCSSMPARWKEGRFYSGSDDLYWRLSFGDDSPEEQKGRDVRGIWYDSDDEFNVSKSSSKIARSKPREVNRLRFNDMISERKDITKKQYKVINMEEVEPAGYARKDQEQQSLNRRAPKERKSDMNRRYLEEQERALQHLYENKQLEMVKIRDELQKSRVLHKRSCNLLCRSCSSRMLKGNCLFDYLDLEDTETNPEEEFCSEMQKLECKKINEIISRNEQHRVSVHVSRPVLIKGRKANKKVNSPTRKNTSKTECKPKETEDKRTKRIIKDMNIGVEAETAFDSYAVQKTSYDPDQDFRDSMLEMIIDQGINQPEELEELLVCYLTLNRDEYHDLIIKVFQQVWFDLIT